MTYFNHDIDELDSRSPRERGGRGRPRRGDGHRGGGRRGGPHGHRGREPWSEFAPAMRMPRHERGGGRGRRGDVRAAALVLLAEEPRNGYQIIKAVAERTDDLWKPGPGSVYPALGLLEDEGLIEPRPGEGSNRKVFALTEVGTAYVAEHADELADPFARVTSPHSSLLDARREIGQLAMAVQQVVVAGDEKQIAATRALLADTRRSVYRMLAQDDTTSTD